MPIHNFDDRQKFISIDERPDHREDEDQLNSKFSVYNHSKADMSWAERMVFEWINYAGAWVSVLKIVRNEGTADNVYEEDPNPQYDKALKLKGYMAPPPPEVVITRWGIDQELKPQIHFSRAAVLKMFGERMISSGDIIIFPHNTLSVFQNTDFRTGPGNRLDRFRVLTSGDTGNFHYRWLYWTCTLENLIGDESISDSSKEIA